MDLPVSTCGVLVRGLLLAALAVVGTASVYQLFTLHTAEFSLGGTGHPLWQASPQGVTHFPQSSVTCLCVPLSCDGDQSALIHFSFSKAD